MLKKLNCFLLLLPFMIIVGCSAGPAKMVETDLSSYDIPIKINVPEGAEFSTEGLFVERGVDITKKKFMLSVEVYEEYADESGDIATIIQDDLDFEKEMEGFDKVILEEAAGYIYSTVDDDGKKDYNFLHVKIVNGLEIHFTSGISFFSNYTEDEIKIMYDAAKAAVEL